MRVKDILPAFDAADIEAESAFWARLLGGEVERHEDGDWHTVRVGGEEKVCVQLAPDHQPPQWPDGAPQQMHLDLVVEDIAEAHRHALDSGAVLLQDADRNANGGFVVYADPAGHPFCLCW